MMTSNLRTTPSSQSPRFLTRCSSMRKKLNYQSDVRNSLNNSNENDRTTPSIPGSASNDVEKAQGPERRCPPTSCSVAPADASWHPKMDSPAGETDVQC